MDAQNPSDLDQNVAAEETAMPVEEGTEQKKPAHPEGAEEAQPGAEAEVPPADATQE